jgi:hypothetical protein
LARCANWDRFVHWYKTRHIPSVDPIFQAGAAPAAPKERTPMSPVAPAPRWKPVHTCFMWLVGCPSAIGLAAVVISLTTYHERTTRRMELDAMLKQDMLQRNFTAQEIEAVLTANSETGRYPNNQNDFMRNQLVRDLRKQGMKAEDIERVVRAAYPPSATPPPSIVVRGPAAPAPRVTPPTVTEPTEPAAPPEPRQAMPFARN